MLVLPFHTKVNGKEVFGFSVSSASKAFLFASGFLGFVCLSSAYHSVLYGYTMPNWAIPVFILATLPFGWRKHIGLTVDKTHLVNQNRLFGIKLSDKQQIVAAPLKTFRLVETNALEKQYYFVVSNHQLNESVFYCRVKSKKKNDIEAKIGCLLGLNS
ncbi:hypothetical protein [Vibrio vulnificus]|uniref:hypothetical protein n=1 Tax=Vibrio vulnificus TaxID=672 RepID=UPI000CD2B1B1|nr:hypothetical protein [Vibrio vulnificus]POC39295.1 hypothetical protein CRN55_08680 [Vibrio vulnificus]